MKIKGWRTRLFALAVSVLGIVEVIDPTLIANVVGDEYRGWAYLTIALVTVLLREITKEPAPKIKIGNK